MQTAVTEVVPVFRVGEWAEWPHWRVALRAGLIGAAVIGLLHAVDVSAAEATNPDFTKAEPTFALPDGRLQGCGVMNAPGPPLTIGMVLARGAGVEDVEVAHAIELSARLLRFYTGKGSTTQGVANRLNADSLLPESRRFTRSNLDRIQTDPTSDSSFGRVPRGTTRPVYTEIPPLMKSGLFGPVSIFTPTN